MRGKNAIVIRLKRDLLIDGETVKVGYTKSTGTEVRTEVPIVYWFTIQWLHKEGDRWQPSPYLCTGLSPVSLDYSELVLEKLNSTSQERKVDVSKRRCSPSY